MNPIALVGAGVVLGAVAAGAALAVGDDGEDTVSSTSRETEPVTASECVTAVPAESIGVLGISGEAALTAPNECSVVSGSREITVTRRPLVFGGTSPDEKVAVRQAYELACGLIAEADAVQERSAPWLEGRTACARTPLSGRGLSEVAVLTDQGALVEIRVVQLDLTSAENLREGLAGLVAAAEVVW